MEPELLDHQEPHDAGMAARLSWLRAGVLGANDGIVSTACLGQAQWPRPVLRNVLGGGLAMAVTYGIGTLVGRAI